MLTSLTSKGQITIPKSIRRALNLSQGDKVEFILTEDNQVILKPVTNKVDDVFGSLSKYKKTIAVSIEEMNQAIENKLKNRFQ